MIECLLFDLGKVIVDFDMEPAVRAVTARCAVDRDEVERVLWSQDCIRRYERGEIDTPAFHRFLVEHAQLDMPYADFRRAWSSIFHPQTLLPLELFETLKHCGYPLILVSNTNEAHVDYIGSHFDVFRHFDRTVFSHEVGALKPDRRIFEAAIQASGFPSSSLFYTDDREENVAAAAQCGMTAHRFRSQAELLRAFHSSGIRLSD